MSNRINLLLLFICLVGMRGVRAAENKKPITEACLTCMCEALSGCNDTAICVNGACGIFRLTRDQWGDSGRLVVGNDSPVSDIGTFAVKENFPFLYIDLDLNTSINNLDFPLHSICELRK